MVQGVSLRLLLATVAILAVLLLVSLAVPDSLMASALLPGQPTGSLVVTVQDGFTEQPLQSATVVIPETSESVVTDVNGKTTVMHAPILQDANEQAVLPMNWGEITLLIYREGYIDAAVFHVNIYENQTRQGPTVLLFPLDADGSNAPFTMIESPNRMWVQQLLAEFRPTAD